MEIEIVFYMLMVIDTFIEVDNIDYGLKLCVEVY